MINAHSEKWFRCQIREKRSQEKEERKSGHERYHIDQNGLCELGRVGIIDLLRLGQWSEFHALRHFKSHAFITGATPISATALAAHITHP